MKTDAEIASIHLASLLAERARAPRPMPKRMRTRLSLVAATAAEMEASGYPGLTIDAVVERAGVARGTFYLYFSNRADAAIAVIRAFNACMRKFRPRGGTRLSAEEAIFRMNLFYVRSYSNNATLLMGREALMRDKPQLALSRDFMNHRWARAILRDLGHRAGEPPGLQEDPGALLAVRTVVAMADEVLRETYVYRSPKLRGIAGSHEQVAEAMAFIWYRALFGRQPALLRPLLPVLTQGVPLVGRAVA